MDVLIDKSYKEYNYISRYAGYPYYYNTLDNKYIQGLPGQLSKDSTFILHKVKPRETLDSIALDSYGNSTFFWVIADFNNIRDPFKPLTEGDVLKIPTLADIHYQEI